MSLAELMQVILSTLLGLLGSFPVGLQSQQDVNLELSAVIFATKLRGAR